MSNELNLNNLEEVSGGGKFTMVSNETHCGMIQVTVMGGDGLTADYVARQMDNQVALDRNTDKIKGRPKPSDIDVSPFVGTKANVTFTATKIGDRWIVTGEASRI